MKEILRFGKDELGRDVTGEEFNLKVEERLIDWVGMLNRVEVRLNGKFEENIFEIDFLGVRLRF